MGLFTSRYDVASVRTLRVGLGMALALAFANLVNWPGVIVAPILASALLCSPAGAPTLKSAVTFALLFGAVCLIGLLLLPMLHHQPVAAVILIILALFHCFYFGARGGAGALTTLLLLGVTVIPVIGSESIDAAIGLSGGLVTGSLAAFLVVWFTHLVLPEPLQDKPDVTKAPAVPPSIANAARSALRSTAIVVPVLIWLLCSVETSGFAIVLLKVATMGQQTSLENARAAGNDLLASTVVGGVAAVFVWNVLQIWPSTVIYSLLFALCGIWIGRRVFAGQGMSPRSSMWSYGLLTMVVIVMPSTMDSAGGDAAATAFIDRIIMFVLATLYAVAAVYVFDRFWPEKSAGNASKVQEQVPQGAHS